MTTKPKRARKKKPGPEPQADGWTDPWPSGSWPAADAESPSELGQPVKRKRGARGPGWGYIAPPPTKTGKR
jgi:hypothetical protein